MYKQLVVAGVLSEAEFWKGRQNLLKQGLHGGQKKKQQPGFQTAMISEQATENGGRKVFPHLAIQFCMLMCIESVDN